MKKVQLLFALAAILTASFGVFASKMSVATYWRNTIANTTFCDVQVTPICEFGSGPQCTLSEESPTAPLYKIDAAGCEILRRIAD
jgi:hypothetical protein